MSKELFVTSTPHETKLAVVEDDQLVEVFFERENEYTLAGSIYKGKVTRVLPGMQSAFVDIGLERDAFLYVTDFLEDVEQDDDDALPAISTSASGAADVESASEGSERGSTDRSSERSSERGGREGRGRGGRGRGRGRGRDGDRGRDGANRRSEQNRAAQASELKPVDDEQEQLPAEPDGNVAEVEASSGEPTGETKQQGQDQSGERLPRRWRGRRGRRRGRSFLNESKYTEGSSEQQSDAAVEGEQENDGLEAEQQSATQSIAGQDAGFVLEHDATGHDEDEQDSADASEHHASEGRQSSREARKHDSDER